MEEFKAFCYKAAADSPGAIFASIDTDGDGQLSLVLSCSPLCVLLSLAHPVVLQQYIIHPSIAIAHCVLSVECCLSRNDDRSPSQQELKEALKERPELDGILHLGLGARSVEGCFKAMDIDGDGNITAEEWCAFCDKSSLKIYAWKNNAKTEAPVVEEAAANLKQNPAAMLQLLPPKAIFASIDTDGDGQLTLVSASSVTGSRSAYAPSNHSPLSSVLSVRCMNVWVYGLKGGAD